VTAGPGSHAGVARGRPPTHQSRAGTWLPASSPRTPPGRPERRPRARAKQIGRSSRARAYTSRPQPLLSGIRRVSAARGRSRPRCFDRARHSGSLRTVPLARAERSPGRKWPASAEARRDRANARAVRRGSETRGDRPARPRSYRRRCRAFAHCDCRSTHSRVVGFGLDGASLRVPRARSDGASTKTCTFCRKQLRWGSAGLALSDGASRASKSFTVTGRCP
jgi:hypothetical protein